MCVCVRGPLSKSKCTGRYTENKLSTADIQNITKLRTENTFLLLLENISIEDQILFDIF